MKSLKQSFTVSYQYDVHFTQNLFDVDNSTFINTLDTSKGPKKVLFCVDQGVIDHHPQLLAKIKHYCDHHADKVICLSTPLAIPGGEQCKNSYQLIELLVKTIDDLGIDRHSYIAAIGGGSVLDAIGFAAAIGHRGIRLIRIPTTVSFTKRFWGRGQEWSKCIWKEEFRRKFCPSLCRD